MLAVKIFDEEHEEDLESAVNDFLRSIPSKTEVIDIQFRVAVAEGASGEQVFCFSAMVVYRLPEAATRVERNRR